MFSLDCRTLAADGASSHPLFLFPLSFIPLPLSFFPFSFFLFPFPSFSSFCQHHRASFFLHRASCFTPAFFVLLCSFLVSNTARHVHAQRETRDPTRTVVRSCLRQTRGCHVLAFHFLIRALERRCLLSLGYISRAGTPRTYVFCVHVVFFWCCLGT